MTTNMMELQVSGEEYFSSETDQKFVIYLLLYEVQDGQKHLVSIVLHINCKTSSSLFRRLRQPHEYDTFILFVSSRRTRFLSRQWRKS